MVPIYFHTFDKRRQQSLTHITWASPYNLSKLKHTQQSCKFSLVHSKLRLFNLILLSSNLTQDQRSQSNLPRRNQNLLKNFNFEISGECLVVDSSSCLFFIPLFLTFFEQLYNLHTHNQESNLISSKFSSGLHVIESKARQFFYNFF